VVCLDATLRSRDAWPWFNTEISPVAFTGKVFLGKAVFVGPGMTFKFENELFGWWL
jgi:hypothetical protein